MDSFTLSAYVLTCINTLLVIFFLVLAYRLNEHDTSRDEVQLRTSSGTGIKSRKSAQDFDCRRWVRHMDVGGRGWDERQDWFQPGDALQRRRMILRHRPVLEDEYLSPVGPGGYQSSGFTRFGDETGGVVSGRFYDLLRLTQRQRLPAWNIPRISLGPHESQDPVQRFELYNDDRSGDLRFQDLQHGIRAPPRTTTVRVRASKPDLAPTPPQYFEHAESNSETQSEQYEHDDWTNKRIDRCWSPLSPSYVNYSRPSTPLSESSLPTSFTSHDTIYHDTPDDDDSQRSAHVRVDQKDEKNGENRSKENQASVEDTTDTEPVDSLFEDLADVLEYAYHHSELYDEDEMVSNLDAGTQTEPDPNAKGEERCNGKGHEDWDKLDGEDEGSTGDGVRVRGGNDSSDEVSSAGGWKCTTHEVYECKTDGCRREKARYGGQAYLRGEAGSDPTPEHMRDEMNGFCASPALRNLLPDSDTPDVLLSRFVAPWYYSGWKAPSGQWMQQNEDEIDGAWSEEARKRRVDEACETISVEREAEDWEGEGKGKQRREVEAKSG
ncbi:hypothetical protein BKA63DRAFT_578659 [Paraphoma chrysanthemicola]|nr:hypothetical protein BKA63DRAFT_578659 [Paraphoma chrysanthemicola]